MFFSILIVAVVVALIWAQKRIAKVPAAQRNATITTWVLIGAAVVTVGLVLTGRAPWVMGVLAALLAVAGRITQLASYMPIFKKIFGQDDSQHDSGDQYSGSSSGAAPSVGMSKQQAAEILGLDVGADAAEIRLAHKRLIQKLHPDRGGSDALAKQINKAKDVLLG